MAKLPYKLRDVAQALAPVFDQWPERILPPEAEQPRLLRRSYHNIRVWVRSKIECSSQWIGSSTMPVAWIDDTGASDAI